MPRQLVECVPNFSEGQDEAKIAQIVAAVKSVAGTEVLHVDPGWDMNRTVVTFLGSPEAVAEAAFRAMAKAAEVIDMSQQQGLHPRIGATDVFPFVPIEGITLAECAEIARQVGRRVGEELKIPVYLYEAAATTPERKNLANIRKGEYEGLATKMQQPEWKPDFGPTVFNPRAGATVIGAREFLVAYNITLNTRDKEAAEDIAFELRERGRIARGKTESPYYHRGEILFYRDGHYPCGNCGFVGKTFAEVEEHCWSAHGYNLRELAKEEFAEVVDAKGMIGKKVRRAGKFKHCKAIGWYADAFKRAQISINLTNYHATPPHLVLEEARKLAAERGLIVTGSEIVGMIPYAALLEAGKYYLEKQGDGADHTIRDMLETAVYSMGLNDVQPFDIDKKVIGLPSTEKRPPAAHHKQLVQLKICEFIDAVSLDKPTPAGGSVAALAGSLGAALATMAAHVAHKFGEDREKKLMVSHIANKAQTAKAKLLDAIDADAEAYNAYRKALKLPKQTLEEQACRTQRIQECLKQATEIPYRTAQASLEAMEVAHKISMQGLDALLADAIVGCEIAYVGVRGSVLNIRANLVDIQDSDYVKLMIDRCSVLLDKAEKIRQDQRRTNRFFNGGNAAQ